jgi:CheY-like chemotaxis protein
MDGPTATRQIREAGCDVFIVGITGNVMPEDVAHFKQAGANSVLGKPFQIEDLESLWVEWGVTTSAANFSDDTTPTVTFDLEQQRT